MFDSRTTDDELHRALCAYTAASRCAAVPLDTMRVLYVDVAMTWDSYLATLNAWDDPNRVELANAALRRHEEALSCLGRVLWPSERDPGAILCAYTFAHYVRLAWAKAQAMPRLS